MTKCLKVCQPRFCCFDSYILESSCKATVGETECEVFELCEQMITDDGVLIKTFIELDLQEFNDDDGGISEGNNTPSSSLELIEKEVYDAVSFKPFLAYLISTHVLTYLTSLADLTVLLRR